MQQTLSGRIGRKAFVSSHITRGRLTERDVPSGARARDVPTIMVEGVKWIIVGTSCFADAEEVRTPCGQVYFLRVGRSEPWLCRVASCIS